MLTVVKHSSMQRFKWKCDESISLVIALQALSASKRRMLHSCCLFYVQLQDFQDDSPRVDSDVSSPNRYVVKDFSSPIWQKTVIAKVTAERNDQSKENKPVEVSKTNDEVGMTSQGLVYFGGFI